MTQTEITALQNLILSSQQIAVLLPNNPSFDVVASATALGLALEKAGKKAHLICDTPLTVEYSSLFGVDKIKNSLPENKDLILRFDQSLVDKITRINAEGNTEKLELLIKPKEGIKITPEMVEINYGAMEMDLVVTVGMKAMETKHLDLLVGKTIINVDNQEDNTNFGKFNFTDTKAVSLSELMVYFLKGVNLAPEPDLATNLYAGIIQTTDNLQTEKVTANTLEAAALCLRAGATRNPKPQTPNQIQNSPPEADQPLAENIPSDWLGPKVFSGTSDI